jgi:hypothetical protein
MESEVKLQAFLALVVEGSQWLTSGSGSFILCERTPVLTE